MYLHNQIYSYISDYQKIVWQIMSRTLMLLLPCNDVRRSRLLLTVSPHQPVIAWKGYISSRGCHKMPTLLPMETFLFSPGC